MKNDWTEQQTEIRARVVELARRTLARSPHAPSDLRERFRVLGEFGLLGMAIPEEYGGSGAGVRAALSALEALGHGGVDGGLAFSLGAQMWAVQMPILELGTDEQKHRYLPGLCAGKRIGAIALTEPGAGSDLFSMRARAERREDGFVLTGRKTFCTNAPVADVFVIVAAVGEDRGFGRCSGFLVDRDTPGLFVEQPMPKMGLEASPMADVVLEDCVVPRSALFGRWGRGAEIFHDALTWERGALSAPFVGAMQRQLGACIQYANERRQFDQPIGKFQAVAHRLADMALRLETARLLVHRFAELKEQGEEASLEASLVKIHVSESFVQSSLDAIQIHGGSGYATELGIEADLRDAIGLRIASGTNEIQRNAIARSLGV